MCYSVIDRSWPYWLEATHSTAYLATDILRWVAQHWRGWEGICGKRVIYMYHSWGGGGGETFYPALSMRQNKGNHFIESTTNAEKKTD